MKITIGILVLAVGVVSAQHKYIDMPSQELDSEEHGTLPGEKQTSCNCGWANRFVGRIVGGRDTAVNQYPWIASLMFDGWFPFCGATIITASHVLTAAHCTVKFSVNNMSVLVGGHNFSDPDATDASKTIAIKSIINHEKYIKRGYRNDISLLELQEMIVFSDKVGPACLPAVRDELDLTDKYVKVLGWGRIVYNGTTSDSLLQINFRVIPLEICQEIWLQIRRNKDYIDVQHRTQLCTFSKGRDACQGDSGGPVVYLDPETNRYTLVGVVSYGRYCASDVPSVQTEVAAYLDWIQDHLKNSTLEGKTCSKI